MRKSVIILMLIIGFFYSNVYAGSIDYNIKIDKNKHFYETIIYAVEDDSTNEYLLKVLKDTVYFDKNSSIAYTKTIDKKDNLFIVTLKHDYNSTEIKNSRILNECFNKFIYEETAKRITYYASSPFKCANRADYIQISVKSDIDVILDTANIVYNDTYTWNEIDKNFMMDVSLGEYESDIDVSNEEDKNDVVFPYGVPDDYDCSLPQSVNVPMIVIIVSIVVSIIGIIIYRNLNKKRSEW